VLGNTFGGKTFGENDCPAFIGTKTFAVVAGPVALVDTNGGLGLPRLFCAAGGAGRVGC
jgi:hypothetical protein